MVDQNESAASSRQDPEREVVTLRVALAVLGAAFLAYGVAFAAGKTIPEIALGVGSGVFSSLIVIAVYGRVAEERSLLRVSQRSADASLLATKAFLEKHFEQVVPLRTYPRSSNPTVDFQRDFSRYLERSTSYIHRGADASFAAFRLVTHAHHDAIQKKTHIKICLLDPRDQRLLRQRAKLELSSRGRSYTAGKLDGEASDLQQAIYQTLEALFSIRHARQVQVFFHKDNPFYRAEVLDDALFISYYLGGEYPGTYVFGSNSYVYRAFGRGVELTCEDPVYRIEFTAAMTDAIFMDHLRTLGYGGELNTLAAARKEDFARRKSALPFPATELF